MTENTPGHFPQQVGIDAYGNSGFRFADMSHRGSLLCLPTGMLGWNVTTPAEITLDSLAPVFGAADDIDVLMVGLGHDIIGLLPEIRAALRERGIIVEAITTGSAVRTYNVLLAEHRAVAAALIAVDRVR
ncbi:MAG: Mth938-like domain-containing protein [Devosia sp.]